jgi:polysaccharide biosynthesis protein PslG
VKVATEDAIRRLVLSAALGVALCACSGRMGGIGQVAASGSARRVALGLCEDYPEEARRLAEVRRDLDVVTAAGLDVLRVSIGWDEVEPEPDRYELAFVDDLVEVAAARGVRLLPYVAYTPVWNAEGAPEEAAPRPPRDLARFGALMEMLARRYRGKISSWEIWNAPDSRDHWRGTTADYVKLLQTGAAAVRRGDPAAKVVLGGLAGNVDFLRAVMAAAASSIDVVSLHAYFETWSAEPLERLPGYVAEVAEVVSRAGGRPLWLAEMGYSSHRLGAIVSSSYTAAFSHEHTALFQAQALVRMMTLALSIPQVSLVSWYELKDSPADAEVVNDSNNRHFGVISADHRPKPALAALSLLSRLFDRGFQPLSLEVLRPADPPTEARAFLLADGTALVAAWLPNPTGPQRRFYTGEDADNRRTSLHLRLPCQGTPDAALLDVAGTVRARVPATRSNGGLLLGPVDLRGGETALVTVPVCQRPL